MPLSERIKEIIDELSESKHKSSHIEAAILYLNCAAYSLHFAEKEQKPKKVTLKNAG